MMLKKKKKRVRKGDCLKTTKRPRDKKEKTEEQPAE